MSWIKSHQNLKEHPKLLLLCQKTGLNKGEAIGYLHMFWWWVLDYAEDGDLSKFSSKLVIEGLNLSDLKECGFIDEDEKVHDWLDYAGRYLNDKYRTANPKKLKSIVKKYSRDYRQSKVCKKSGQIDREIDIDRKIDSSKFSFKDILSKYPNKDGSKIAENHFNKSVKTDKDWEDINSALDCYLKSQHVKDGFVKNCSTWFNQWHDWVDQKPPSTRF